MNEISVLEAVIVTICMAYIVWRLSGGKPTTILKNKMLWILKLCRRLKR